MVSRATELFPYFKKCLEDVGFNDVIITGEEKDSLNMVINELQPKYLLIGSCFYRTSTPYMMKQLLLLFPKQNITVLSLEYYPDELAMWFILNGVKSYVNILEGMDEFYHGLHIILKGKTYIAPHVKECIAMRSDYPMPAENITDRQKEVIRLLCCGFKDIEIADNLHISKRTVATHKTEIFTSLNVRNQEELMRTALYLGMIKLEETFFYPKDYILNPLPDMKKGKRKQL